MRTLDIMHRAGMYHVTDVCIQAHVPHLNTGIDHVVDVNHLPSLKDFPDAKNALWSLCRTFHTLKADTHLASSAEGSLTVRV